MGREMNEWIFPTSKNVLLNLDSQNLWTKKGLCTVRELPTWTAALLFLSLMFAAFYNQSPLVTMVLWMASILEPSTLNVPADSEKRPKQEPCFVAIGI